MNNKLLSYKCLIVLSLTLLVGIMSCGEPEEEITGSFIADDFSVVGKWFYRYVSGDGVIFGIPRSDVDDSPSGYVEFFDNNNGFSDFELELLDADLGKEENFQWRWLENDTLNIEESDGQHQYWTLNYADNDSINATWDINILGNTATINAIFTK